VLGRLPAPELVFDLMGELIASAVLLGQDYAEISELSVGKGTLSFVGRIQRWGGLRGGDGLGDSRKTAYLRADADTMLRVFFTGRLAQLG
jgi:hypothetical protein